MLKREVLKSPFADISRHIPDSLTRKESEAQAVHLPNTEACYSTFISSPHSLLLPVKTQAFLKKAAKAQSKNNQDV